MAVRYEDLLGIPYVAESRDPKIGLSCAGVCSVVLDRLGKRGSAVPVSEDDFRAILAEEHDRRDEWQLVGVGQGGAVPSAMLREGDVVEADDGRRLGAGVVVDPAERLVLTSAPESRVRAIRIERLRGALRIWRLI